MGQGRGAAAPEVCNDSSFLFNSAFFWGGGGVHVKGDGVGMMKLDYLGQTVRGSAYPIRDS